MEYKKFNNKYVVRLDAGEEIMASLKQFAEENNVKLASVSAIGATNKVAIGLFNTETKEYNSKEYTGDFEITALTGNISTMDGETYLHLHITLSDENLNCIGGHLNSAVISATLEVVVDVIDGEVDRQFDKNIGLNLLKLS